MKYFDLSNTEIEIKIVVERGIDRFVLTHIVREPTAEEWREFQKRSWRTVVKGRNISIEDSGFEARNWLYDKVALRVIGYSDSGVPLDCTGDSWKSKIPEMHKQQVILDLTRIYSYDGELPKNSEELSENS